MNVVYLQDHGIWLFRGEYYHAKSEHFFSRYLAGLKDDDNLIVYAYVRELFDENIAKKYKKVSHPRIEFRNVPLFRELKNLPSIYKLAKRVVKEADFIYMRTGIASSIAAIYCKKYNVPYMAIVNEDVSNSTRSHSKLLVKLASFPLTFFSKRMIRDANYACYVTKDFLQTLYPCNGESIGCSDIEFLDINESVLKKRLEKIEDSHGTIILGSAGSVATRVKGKDTAIKALAKLKEAGRTNYKYQLVGTGDQTILKRLAAKYGVSEMVEFLGEYKHDDVLKWFDTLDIYVHPSRSEGLPRTVLEAITRACPCVCSSVAGIPELIDREFLFDYDGNEVSSLANLILKMDKTAMKSQAKINFERSKLYKPEFLDQQRSSFFSKVISEVRNRK